MIAVVSEISNIRFTTFLVGFTLYYPCPGLDLVKIRLVQINCFSLALYIAKFFVVQGGKLTAHVLREILDPDITIP
jgi:hypothetical protein